jgi:hypothetical protein
MSQERAQHPHCDALILHSPSTCEFCDFYPDRQAARTEGMTNFSNTNYAGWLPCPSTYQRDAETRDRWPGNTPRGY